MGLVSVTWSSGHILIRHRQIWSVVLPLRFVGWIFAVFQNLSLTRRKQQSELSKAEQVIGVSELMQKITQHQPRITCFVGLGIADIVKSVLVYFPEHLLDTTS